MDVYFVRHGETNGNLAWRHQHVETSLNERGVKQAQAAATEIKLLDPTHLITSTQLRAVETTRIITACCVDLIPETHRAFEELKRPDTMIGSRFLTIKTFWYIVKWFLSGSKIEDEGYSGFILRIKEARQHLETFPADARVVVVSHSVFINIFIEHLCSDERMSFWRAMRRFWFVLKLRNATILHLQFKGKEEGKCGWQFISAAEVYPKS